VTDPQKPDFTGRWTLAPAASSLSARVAATVRSGSVDIEHREPSISMHLRIVFEADAFDAKFDRLSDGREVESSPQPGVRIVSSLRWDGDALVFSDRIESAAGPLTIVFRYELEGEGRRLRASEQLRGQNRDQDNVWVFERS